MSADLFILPPEILIWVVAGFGGIGSLLAIIVVAVTFLQDRAACRPAGKADLLKLSSIESTPAIEDDSEDSGIEENTRNESKEATKKDV